MEKIIEQLQQWEFIRQLPAEIEGFRLQLLQNVQGNQYFLFMYENPAERRRFTLLYDHLTKEFLGRVVVGLTEYCDTTYIVGDVTALQAVLERYLAATLRRLAVFDAAAIDSVVREKKVLSWEYSPKLSNVLGPFHLFISPSQPVKGINGSYIIIDYSWFETESSLVIYYNMYRDEFFGEMKVNQIPQMTALFDCKTLPELAEKLDTHLEAALRHIQAAVT